MSNVIDARERFRPLRCLRCGKACAQGDHTWINVPPSNAVRDGQAPIHVGCMRGGATA